MAWKTLVALGVCLMLAGCEPPDQVVGTMERTLVVTGAKFSKHTHFSFRDELTGYEFNRVGTGKYCTNGKRWKIGTRVVMTVVTYQGKRGRYIELPRSEARKMCR